MTDRVQVLLIDDEKDLLEATKIFLEESGEIEITPVTSADAALQVLGERETDVIVADYQLPPGMNSIELLKVLRAKGNETPFIIFTGRGREDVAMEALNNGASFYLQKGINPEVQFAELRNMIIQVAQRLKAEAAFRESEERYRLIIENTPVVVISLAFRDSEVEILSMNPVFEQLTGWPGPRWAGRPIEPLIHPDDRVSFMAALQESRTGHITLPIEIRIQTQSGSYVIGEAAIAPNIKNRQVIGAIAVIQDRTEHQKMLNLLKESSASLEASNRELEAFCYSVSHDLRAPLRVIDGYSRMILEQFGTTVPGPVKGHLDRIEAATRKMQDLIDALLKLSRVNRATFNSGKVNLSAMADEILASLAQQSPGRRVRCEVMPGIVAVGDRALLQTLLQNLLDNAWKYTSRVEDARITFAVKEENGTVVYFVRDNGAGFDAAHAENLFLPFTRFHTESEFQGNGIGLATVARIVTRHGGRIWAESLPDQGATFFFSLPPPA